MANLTLWEQIKELKSPKYKWVDLTHELSPETPHWFGFKPLQADLLFDYAEGTPEDMMAPMRCIQYSVASQYGTHTDVPRGKTNFINGILEDGFARQDPTLLLCCEEGEEEYEKNALDNVTVITIEDEEDLKCSYLKELEKEYHPKQVLIEYNGMWQMERLYREVLPANWVLYQIMTFVYAPTFEMYAKNMGQLMMEKITNADMLVFNRCTPDGPDSRRH